MPIESPKGAYANSTPEYEIITESRDVVRVLGLQPATLQELYEHMLPTPQVIREVLATMPDKEKFRQAYQLLSTAMPRLTISVWLLKEGRKSDGQILLPGGKMEAEHPTSDDVVDEGKRELQEETGHTVMRAYHQADCDRTYSFESTLPLPARVKTVRTNRESLVIAHIPRGQNTLRRFQRNENIQIPLRLSPPEVSKLLAKETYASKHQNGVLLDSLSLNPDRHEKNAITIDMDETMRTRKTIEKEAWMFEAICWKKLIMELDRTTTSKKTRHFRKLIRSIQQMPDPTDIMSSDALIIKIRSAIEARERSYPYKRKPIKHRLSKQDYVTLLKNGIPKKIIRRRMVLMDEIRVAYRAAFMGK